MLRNYLPVLLLLGFVMFNAVVIIGLSHLSVRAQPTPVKSQPYESGIAPLGDARDRFSVKFYLVAMLFIVFDIETVFMIPWGVHYRQLSCAVPMVADACPTGQLSFFGLGEMLVFAVAVFASFIFLIANGALDWGPVQALRRSNPAVNPNRTTASTIRRVGADGRPADDQQGVAA